MGTAQSIERPTEKPGTILPPVRVPGTARDFYPRINFQCRYFLLRCPHSPREQSHASTSVRVKKSQTLEAIPLFGHTKILHTPIGMGSAALAAAVPYPGKTSRIFRKGQISTKHFYFFIFLDQRIFLSTIRVF